MQLEALQRIMPNAGARAEQYLDPLTRASDEWSINTPARLAAFLSQVAVESKELQYLSENMNYSALRLMQVFPRHFKYAQDAEAFAHRPEDIANFVYANRLGNGDQKSGDGWRHRGAGLIQITGKDNHHACADALQIPREEIGDYLRTIEGACRGSSWFWKIGAGLNLSDAALERCEPGCDLNEIADRGDFEAVTLAITGGRTAIKERREYFERALEALA